jgi:ZIP family zinc transporter
MNPNTGFAFLLTLLAGLSTGIGGAIVYFAKTTNRSVLSLGLGFSAGVMIYISFVEMLASARTSLAVHYGPNTGSWIAVAGFFAGMMLIALIDRLVPDHENPHEAKGLGETIVQGNDERKLLRLGLLTGLVIGIHNFPEGLATFVAAISAPTRGISVAIAIAIHNIPEGIAVAVPIYFATKSRRKAVGYAFLSGLSEPIGAVAGYAVATLFLPEHAMGVVHAIVAGIMVFISLDQLIPNAHAYCKGHLPMYGLVSGMAIMALTLLLLQ